MKHKTLDLNELSMAQEKAAIDKQRIEMIDQLVSQLSSEGQEILLRTLLKIKVGRLESQITQSEAREALVRHQIKTAATK